MTRLEADDRARRIWGADQVVVVVPAYTYGAGPELRPGRPAYDVVLQSGARHGFDCNGHPTCHHACDVASVDVCP